MKKVVLTGATGFIARYAIPFLLQRGYEVHAVFHNKEPFSALDFTDRLFWHHCDLLNIAEQKILFGSLHASHLIHFAWKVDHRTYLSSPDNLLWQVASLELLKNFKEEGGERAVYAGTCFEYDLMTEGPLKEDAALNSLSPYGVSKIRLYQEITSYAVEEKFSCAWGRVFFLYGPHEQATRFIPALINAFLRKETACCLHGQLLRDFLYVEDVASAFVAILDSSVCGAVNIGSGVSRSLRDIATDIASGCNKNGAALLKVDCLPTHEPLSIVADVTRLKSEVGWSPSVDWAEGMAKTIAWWKERLTESRDESTD